MRKSIAKNILYQCTCKAVLQVVNYSCLQNTKIKVPYSGIHTWIDLKTVITLVGIFKQAVHWIEHFVRKEKEPLSDRKKNYDTCCWVYNQNWLPTAIFHSYHTLVQIKQSLPCNTTVVQAFLSFKDNIKPTTQVMWSISHDLVTKTKPQCVCVFLKSAFHTIFKQNYCHLQSCQTTKGNHLNLHPFLRNILW